MKPVVCGMTLLVALALGGCASISVEENLNDTNVFAKARFGTELRWLNSDEARREAQGDVDKLLDKPLSQEDASRLSLAYSPAFQAMIAENASGSARATQSARLPNPIFTFEKLVRMEDGVRDLDIGRMIAFSVLDILYLPSRIGLANNTQQGLRLKSAGDVVQTVTEARQSWVKAVAAQQSVAYYEQVMDAAEAGAELARRMQGAGNFSRMQRARQQAFYAEAAAQVMRARQADVEARETLIRTLGLSPEQAKKLKLPERLPDLPKLIRDEQSVAQQSLDERVDVRMARFELNTVARTRGLTRVQSVLEGLHVGVVNNSATGKEQQRGYELEFPIPIFDFGDARRAGAQADYMAAVYRAQQTAIDASSQVRQQYSAYRTAHALARHYREEIVPLRKTISDEQLLKYNGMLIGVFELLADSREQITSVVSAIEAERDFWLADAALQATLIGKPMSGGPVATRAVASAGGAAH